MIKKFIGILIFIQIFLTIVIPVSASFDVIENRATSYDSDVPIWEKNDEWTYHFTESRSHQYNYVLSGDITLRVVDDSGDSYILEGKTKPEGTFDLGGFGLKTTRLTKLSMRLTMRKNDLGLEKFTEKFWGIFLFRFGPITLPIPIHFEACYSIEFDPTWALIPFPLYNGKVGNLSGTEILHNVYVHLYWGLVPVYGPQNLTVPFTPLSYTCYEEQITVLDNTFDVYNLSAEWMDGSRFISYYCEEVGNVAKEVIYIPYGGGTVWHSLILELKDWSYSP
jgi:hypothetical protein